MTQTSTIATLLAGIFAGAILVTPVVAQELTGTMKKIKET